MREYGETGGSDVVVCGPGVPRARVYAEGERASRAGYRAARYPVLGRG